MRFQLFVKTFQMNVMKLKSRNGSNIVKIVPIFLQKIKISGTENSTI